MLDHFAKGVCDADGGQPSPSAMRREAAGPVVRVSGLSTVPAPGEESQGGSAPPTSHASPALTDGTPAHQAGPCLLRCNFPRHRVPGWRLWPGNLGPIMITRCRCPPGECSPDRLGEPDRGEKVASKLGLHGEQVPGCWVRAGCGPG